MPRAPRDAPLKVADNKKRMLALLLEVAARLTWCQATSERGRVYCVADMCGFNQGQVLSRALARESMPEWETLDKLATGTKIPRTRWLIELEWLTAPDIADALKLSEPPAFFSADDQLLLAYFKAVVPETLRRLAREAAWQWIHEQEQARQGKDGPDPDPDPGPDGGRDPQGRSGPAEPTSEP